MGCLVDHWSSRGLIDILSADQGRPLTITFISFPTDYLYLSYSSLDHLPTLTRKHSSVLTMIPSPRPTTALTEIEKSSTAHSSEKTVLDIPAPVSSPRTMTAGALISPLSDSLLHTLGAVVRYLEIKPTDARVRVGGLVGGGVPRARRRDRD